MMNADIFHITVDDENDVGMRLDKFLTLKTDLSRTRVLFLIKNGYLKQIIDKIEYSRENDYEFVLDIHLK